MHGQLAPSDWGVECLGPPFASSEHRQRWGEVTAVSSILLVAPLPPPNVQCCSGCGNWGPSLDNDYERCTFLVLVCRHFVRDLDPAPALDHDPSAGQETDPETNHETATGTGIGIEGGTGTERGIGIGTEIGIGIGTETAIGPVTGREKGTETEIDIETCTGIVTGTGIGTVTGTGTGTGAVTGTGTKEIEMATGILTRSGRKQQTLQGSSANSSGKASDVQTYLLLHVLWDDL